MEKWCYPYVNCFAGSNHYIWRKCHVNGCSHHRSVVVVYSVRPWRLDLGTGLAWFSLLFQKFYGEIFPIFSCDNCVVVVVSVGIVKNDLEGFRHCDVSNWPLTMPNIGGFKMNWGRGFNSPTHLTIPTRETFEIELGILFCCELRLR